MYCPLGALVGVWRCHVGFLAVSWWCPGGVLVSWRCPGGPLLGVLGPWRRASLIQERSERESSECPPGARASPRHAPLRRKGSVCGRLVNVGQWGRGGGGAGPYPLETACGEKSITEPRTPHASRPGAGSGAWHRGEHWATPGARAAGSSTRMHCNVLMSHALYICSFSYPSNAKIHEEFSFCIIFVNYF